jgi:hypothetical protein
MIFLEFSLLRLGYAKDLVSVAQPSKGFSVFALRGKFVRGNEIFVLDSDVERDGAGDRPIFVVLAYHPDCLVGIPIAQGRS